MSRKLLFLYRNIYLILKMESIKQLFQRAVNGDDLPNGLLRLTLKIPTTGTIESVDEKSIKISFKHLKCRAKATISADGLTFDKCQRPNMCQAE